MNTRVIGWAIAATCILVALERIMHTGNCSSPCMHTGAALTPATPQLNGPEQEKKNKEEVLAALAASAAPAASAASRAFAGQYEFYMIDSRFTKLRDSKWLLDLEVISWPAWVLTAMTNYAYCRKHGYKLTLWATPDAAISGFTNRGWGNALVAQYIKTQLDLGVWPDRNWLVYLDSDSYIRQQNTRVEDFLASETFLTPIEVEPADDSRALRDWGNTPKVLKKSRKVENVKEESFLLVAPEVPIPVVLPEIAKSSWLNSGVLFFNMKHNMTSHLLTRWSRSVLDLCGELFRTDRFADQYCLNDMFIGKDQELGYMKYLAIPKDHVSFNTPAGNFIRHSWGENGGFTFVLMGMEMVTQGYQSKNQLVALMLDMVNSGALRQLPMVVGDNSPAYTPKGDAWDIQTEDMMKKAAALLRTTWKVAHSRSVISGIPVAVTAGSSSECIVVADRDHNCLAVSWRVAEDMTGKCICYGSVTDTSLSPEPYTMTWTLKTSGK